MRTFKNEHPVVIVGTTGRQVLCNMQILKGKAIQLQAWRGPEGSRGLRFPHFKTIDT